MVVEVRKEEKINNKNMKNNNIILILFGFLVLLSVISFIKTITNDDIKEDYKIKTIEEMVLEEQKKSIPKEIILFGKIEGQIEALKFLYESKAFIGSRRHHDYFFIQINLTQEILSESKSIQIDTIKSKHNELSNYLIKIQKEIFPKIRKEYFLDIKEKMWLENIKVTSSGTGTSRLHFEGGLFASNQNKQDFQNLISSTIRDYRFKRVYYKWYEYDEDGVYYTINSKEDNEL